LLKKIYLSFILGLGYYGRAFTLKDPSCKKVGCEFSGAANAGECTDAPGTLAWFEIEKIKKEKSVKSVYDKKSMSKILVFDQVLKNVLYILFYNL
jgi:chitinase